ncbi:MAG: exo-alpha-sialidase [Ruminococcaceae bacterium]|nr:exo-alpha-sialidase [Oscillospiraceae bacterium]
MKFTTGIVGRQTGMFAYQGWPTVCRDENGVLYAACSGHRIAHVCPFGVNYLYTSTDEGKTWSPPAIINETDLDDRDAGILALGGGKMLMTYFHNDRSLIYNMCETDNTWANNHRGRPDFMLYEAMLAHWRTLDDETARAGSFIRLSDDSGRSWTPAVKVPVSSPHGPIKLKDGRLLYLGKECASSPEEFGDAAALYEKGAVFAFESRDEGHNWQCIGKVDFPDGCTLNNIHEPYAIELPDGTLLGALRGDRDPVPHGFSVYFTRSEDGGRTWSHPEATDICGSPPHMLLHSSGAVVLVYGRRKPPFGERARISWDGGRTFGEELIIGDEADSGDLGYPSTVELSDGSLYTVYYQRFPGDQHCSILYTHWELPQK